MQGLALDSPEATILPKLILYFQDKKKIVSREGWTDMQVIL